MSPISTRRDGAVLEVTLDRPKANAIDLATSRLMGETFKAFRDDPDLRVAIVTGAGDRFFCAGWDLKAAAAGDPVDGDYGVGGFGGLQELPNLNKPVIAAINGPCAGLGASLPLAMDIRLASETAHFNFLFARRGMLPECGSTWFLPRLVGVSKALEWCMTGRVFDAGEALAGGLVLALPGLLLLVLPFLPGERIRALFRWLFRTFFGLRIEGAERFAHAGPRRILVANHVSFLDGPLLLAEDRTPAIRFEGSTMHPPDARLWG